MKLAYSDQPAGTVHFYLMDKEVKIFKIGDKSQLVCLNTGDDVYFDAPEKLEHIKQCIVPGINDGYKHVFFIEENLQLALKQEGHHAYVWLVKQLRQQYGWDLFQSVHMLNLVLMHLESKDSIELLIRQYGKTEDKERSAVEVLEYVKEREKPQGYNLRVFA